MITLERNHDYFHDHFNEYPVFSVKATCMESPSVILFLLQCRYLLLLLSTIQVLLLLIIRRLSHVLNEPFNTRLILKVSIYHDTTN